MDIDQLYYAITLLIVVMIGIECDAIIQTESNMTLCELCNDRLVHSKDAQSRFFASIRMDLMSECFARRCVIVDSDPLATYHHHRGLQVGYN